MLRGKGVYINFALMLLVIALMIFVFRAAVNTGVTISEEMETIESGPISAIIPAPEEIMNGAVAVQIALDSMDGLGYYFILPLIIMVAMAAFSSGAIKNDLAVGINRTKLYLSKLILSSALSFVFMFLYVALAVIFAIMIDGIGYWGGFSEKLLSFGMQLFIMLAVNSVGIFFCFATRRTAAAIGAFLAFAFIPIMIAALLSVAFPRALDFFYYDLMYQLVIFSQTAGLTCTDFIRGIVIGLVYLVVPTIGGILLFRKVEIK